MVARGQNGQDSRRSHSSRRSGPSSSGATTTAKCGPFSVSNLRTRPLPLEPGDFYPDALPCLRGVAAAGLRVGIAGNQPQAAEEMLRRVDAPISLVASSSRWGVERPSPAFFERICVETAVEPDGVAYVGDRVDNDVLPAKAAGMFAVLVRRGPWGYLHARRPEAATADLRLDNLTSLVKWIVAAR